MADTSTEENAVEQHSSQGSSFIVQVNSVNAVAEMDRDSAIAERAVEGVKSKTEEEEEEENISMNAVAEMDRDSDIAEHAVEGVKSKTEAEEKEEIISMETIPVNLINTEEASPVRDERMDYRAGSSSSGSESSSSDDESGPEIGVEVKSDNGSEDEEEDCGKLKKTEAKSQDGDGRKARTHVKTKGELALEDLPPIELLQITVDDSVQLIEVGSISAVIGVLVIIQGKIGIPALNLESVLFLEGRKSIGQIFETFGPVSCPLYSVRFNSQEDIEEIGIEKENPVFYAPDKEEYTKFVFVSQLASLKGSDASWKENNEPPNQHLDYSDDEQERRARRTRRGGADGEEADDGDKENTKVKKNRNNKQREKRQKMLTEGEGHNAGQLGSEGHRGRGGGRNRGRGRTGFQSWPPKRGDFCGEQSSDSQFRPPPPPQIIPEGYIPPPQPTMPHSSNPGFRMHQPKPFRPPGSYGGEYGAPQHHPAFRGAGPNHMHYNEPAPPHYYGPNPPPDYTAHNSGQAPPPNFNNRNGPPPQNDYGPYPPSGPHHPPGFNSSSGPHPPPPHSLNRSHENAMGPPASVQNGQPPSQPPLHQNAPYGYPPRGPPQQPSPRNAGPPPQQLPPHQNAPYGYPHDGPAHRTGFGNRGPPGANYSHHGGPPTPPTSSPWPAAGPPPPPHYTHPAGGPAPPHPMMSPGPPQGHPQQQHSFGGPPRFGHREAPPWRK